MPDYYFFLTRVPLLTFSIFKNSKNCIFYFIFQWVSSWWFGEAILRGCKTRWFKKNEKTLPKGGAFGRGIQWLVQEFFSKWVYETLMDIMFFTVFPHGWLKVLWWHLTTVILKTFSYFTFHNFHIYFFVQNFLVSMFFSFGGGVHHCEKKRFQNSTHLLFWTYMYFCNVLKNQYKKANTSINVAIALWLKQLFILIFPLPCPQHAISS